MEEFIKMLKGVKPDIDFEHETALVDDGLLESLDIISIISVMLSPKNKNITFLSYCQKNIFM